MAPSPAVAWASYLRRLERRPLSTKCLTSWAMFFVSQVLAQLVTSGRVSSARKLLDFCLWGLINPIASHNWQNFLAAYGPTNILVKIPFDHLLYRVPVLAVFQVYVKLMENKTLKDAWHWTVQNNPKLQLVSLKLWPTVNIVNYLFVPLPLRVLYQNVVLFFWVLYLSLADKAGKVKSKVGRKAIASGDSHPGAREAKRPDDTPPAASPERTAAIGLAILVVNAAPVLLPK